MKKSLILAMALVPGILFAQETKKKEVNLTIYNQNFGVVKEVRSANLTKGEMELKLTDIPERIIPSTVKAEFPGTIYEQNYRYDLVDMNKILEKYIDSRVTLKNKDGAISGILLSAGREKAQQRDYYIDDRANAPLQAVIRTDKGGLVMIPDISEYQVSVDKLPEGFVTKPTLLWNINANKSGAQDINLTYQTEGISWTAQYVALLNKEETKIDLKAWVSIDNHSGMEYKDAGLKLMAGDVNNSVYDRGGVINTVASQSSYKNNSFEEKAFFDYHLYELNNKVTLADNETKQMSLFEVKNIPVKKSYSLNFQYRDDASFDYGLVNSAVSLEFTNTKDNNLGIPIPMGVVNINKTEGNTMEFIGSDEISHTPKDEVIKLQVGKSFDVVSEIKSKERKEVTYKVYDNTEVIEIKNHKDDADVVVDVYYTIKKARKWEVFDSEFTCKNTDNSPNNSSVIFKVPVAAGKTQKLTIKSRVTEW